MEGGKHGSGKQPPLHTHSGSWISLCCCEKFILKKKRSHTCICICMCVCGSPLGRCSVSSPTPSPWFKSPAWKMSLQCLKGLDDFNFIQQSTMIARHFWAKADGNMPPPISTLALANVLTWKAFWENETSPQKSIGDPYFLWLDMHRSAARIIICKLIDPNVMQTILEWEAESLNGLCIFCWLHSQMWQWPWWPTSNQAGQGRGAAIIWEKARLQKFFNFTFCRTHWQLIWQGYWMRSQETCMWSQLVIRAKVCRMAYYLPGTSLWFTHIVSLIPHSKSSRRVLVLPFSFSNHENKTLQKSSKLPRFA